jgi:hypothetical protein
MSSAAIPGGGVEVATKMVSEMKTLNKTVGLLLSTTFKITEHNKRNLVGNCNPF